MGRATQDRGEIVHWAGHHQRSPALKIEQSIAQPVFVGHGADPGSVRCGWEPFFDAMRDRDLVFVLEDDAATATFISPAPVSPTRDEHPSLGAELDHAKRCGQALIAFAKRLLRTSVRT